MLSPHIRSIVCGTLLGIIARGNQKGSRDDRHTLLVKGIDRSVMTSGGKEAGSVPNLSCFD
jgi:hypothetical protein